MKRFALLASVCLVASPVLAADLSSFFGGSLVYNSDTKTYDISPALQAQIANAASAAALANEASTRAAHEITTNGAITSAQTAASGATTAAINAQAVAGSAQTVAQTAAAAATAAQQTAGSLQTTVTAAQQAATSAQAAAVAAQKQAADALLAGGTAQTTATAAQTAAASAQTAANSVQAGLTTAQQNAAAAQAAATTAQQNAASALAAGNTAQTTATAAQTAAAAAQTAVGSVQSGLTAAQAAATTAQQNAAAALAAGNSAQTTATAAQTAAAAANTTANGVQSGLAAAQQTATAAQSTATTAQQQAAAAVTAGNTASAAAATAQQAASAAAAGATGAAPPNGFYRSHASRATDVFNPLDYGALGDGSGQTISTKYGANLQSLASFQTPSGAHPFAFATDPKFGLTFTMTPSAPSATATQTFMFDHGGPNASAINGIRANVAIWQDPAYGSYLVSQGMLVTGACLPAGGTTIALDTTDGSGVVTHSIGRTPGSAGAPDPTYGTIKLAAAPTSTCSSSTPLTFTMAPAQVQALTVDWLGWQAAIAQAYYAPTGGIVRGPQGLYVLNHSLLNPGGRTDSNQILSYTDAAGVIHGMDVDVGGAGIKETTLYFPTDLGLDMGAITEASSGAESVQSASSYHDLFIRGPADGHVIGTGNTVNKVLEGMDGLRIGRGADLHSMLINGFNAGVSGVNDHWNLRDIQAGNNSCGVLFRPYTYTMGNQKFEDGSLAGNYVGSVCVSTTNQFDSGLVKNVHTGFGPHGFWYLPDTANTVSRAGFLSNTTLIDVWIEGVGHCWMCGANHTGQVNNNVFQGAGGDGVTGNALFALPNGSGGYVAPTGIVDAASFTNNTMIGTNWNSYGALSDAAVVASGFCGGNEWINDPQFVFFSTPTVNQFDCGGLANNTFSGPYGSGVFRNAFYADTTQYQPLVEYGYSGVFPFVPGLAFAGLAASNVTHGPHRSVAVIKSAPSIPPSGIPGINGAPKGNPAQSVGLGEPVFADAGGVFGGLSQTHAIGVTISDSPPGANVIPMALDPGMANGSPGAAVGLTAAGNSQATAFAIVYGAAGAGAGAEMWEFTTVPSGAGATLGIIPVGTSETVCNDGANPLLVYPQVGGSIQGLAQNAAATVASGVCTNFRRLSATLWHQ